MALTYVLSSRHFPSSVHARCNALIWLLPPKFVFPTLNTGLTRKEQKHAPKEKAEDIPVILGANGELEGWLLKRGDKGITKALVDLTWKKRWFKQTGSKLCYFEGRNSSGPKGEINLPDVVSVDPVQSPMFGFHIVTRDRIFIVRTQSPPERDLWVKLLRERCPGLVKNTSPRLIQPDITTPIEPLPQRSASASVSGPPGQSLVDSLQSSTQQPQSVPQASPRYLDEAPPVEPAPAPTAASLDQQVHAVPVSASVIFICLCLSTHLRLFVEQSVRARRNSDLRVQRAPYSAAHWRNRRPIWSRISCRCYFLFIPFPICSARRSPDRPTSAIATSIEFVRITLFFL